MSLRCRTCVNPQVAEIDKLIVSGSPVRRVARLYRLSRSSLARHRAHIASTGGRFALVEGQAGPTGPLDPLAAAFELAAKATMPRQRLQALEAIRRATKIALRGVELDKESAELLDRNLRAAEREYQTAPSFDLAVRALAGVREAVLHKLDSAAPADPITTSWVVTLSDGTPSGESRMFEQSRDAYFRGVPRRFRDAERFVVHRRIVLHWPGTSEAAKSDEQIVIREVSTGTIAWAK